MSKPRVLVETPVRTFKHYDVFTEQLKAGDEMFVIGLRVSINAIITNNRDELVLHLDIVGAPIKKRSKMMLIVPQKMPATILVEEEE